jgi:hypothetical protein
MAEENKMDEGIKVAGSAAAGAAAGYGVVAATGMTAIGAVGGGAGVGMAAGPVGAVAGAVTGLAVYGLYRLFK